MCPSEYPVGAGVVGDPSSSPGLPGIPEGSLVFVDINGAFMFTTPGGIEFPAPSSAPSVVSGQQPMLAALDTGQYLVVQQPPASGPATAVATLFDGGFNVIGTQELLAHGVGSDFSNNFYLWEYDSGDLYQLSPSNDLEDLRSVPVPGSFSAPANFAINPDVSKIYFSFAGAHRAYQCSPSGTDGEEDFWLDDGHFGPANSGLIALRNGDVLISWTLTGVTPKTWRVGPTGSEDVKNAYPEGDVPFSDSNYLISQCVATDDDSFWWSWWDASASAVRVERKRLSDGVVLQAFAKTPGAFAWETATMAVASAQAVTTSVAYVAFSGGKNLNVDGSNAVYGGYHWLPPAGRAYPYLIQSGVKLTVAAAGIKIDGSVSGSVMVRAGNADGMTIAYPDGVEAFVAATGEYRIENVDADVAFPSGTAKFYDTFQLRWEVSIDSGPWIQVGVSSNPVYVILANPTTSPLSGTQIFRTVAHLACQLSGSTAATAAADTWSRFAAPNNVVTWDGRHLFYYQPGYDFVQNTDGGIVTVSGLLRMGRGQCGAWATMLQSAWALNSINCTYVTASCSVTGSVGFWVKEWLYTSAVSPFWFQGPAADMIPTPAAGPFSHYDNPSNPLYFLNAASSKGQGTQGASDAPSEKWFNNHQFLCLGETYYDPSYGIQYSGAADFQSYLSGYSTVNSMTPDNLLLDWHAFSGTQIGFDQTC